MEGPGWKALTRGFRGGEVATRVSGCHWAMHGIQPSGASATAFWLFVQYHRCPFRSVWLKIDGFHWFGGVFRLVWG